MRRFLATALGASVWALACGFGSAPYAVGPAIFSAVAASLMGSWASRGIAASRLRLAAIWGLGLVAILGGWFFALFARGYSILPLLLGTRAAFTLGDMVFWGALSFTAVAVLQATSRRRRWFLALELCAAGAVFASLFTAHREGFINRPYGLVDPLWSRGYDPLPVFLALGIGVGILLMVLAVARNRGRRSVLDIGLLAALALALFLVFPAAKLKDLLPRGAGSQGISGDPGPGSKEDRRGPKGSASTRAGDSRKDGELGPPERGQSGGQDQGPGAGADSTSSFSNQSSGDSNQPVAVVLFHDDYDPPEGYYYFRQTAFSQFNGMRLVQDATGKADADVSGEFPTGPEKVPVPKGSERFLRPLDTTVALLAVHAKPFGLVNPTGFAPAQNPDPTRFQRAYSVESLVFKGEVPRDIPLQPGSRGWDQALWEHYTAAPQDPRYERLAEECLERVKPYLRDNPFARAAAVKILLEKTGTYSLTSNHEAASDPLADFLFGDRVGHCVYFAHSACLLWRTLGVPSRVGAGYAVEARVRGGGDAVLLRERDAHAWPEIYLDGIGWVILDISPEKSVSGPEPSADPGLQQMMGEMARQKPGNPKLDQKPAGEGDIQKALKSVLRAALAMLALLAALFVAGLYSFKVWRRSVPRFCAEPDLSRVAYRSCLDRLAEGGVVRPFGMSRETFAASGSVSPSLERLTDLHLRKALGRGAPVVRRAEVLELERRAAEERLARAPRWRRILGLLDPFSWLKVK
jgi:protein-glutamine gamma-glutamyltransferase